MRAVFLLPLLAVSPALLAQQAPLKSLPYTPSLDTSFMDRSTDPCLNFYRYSCGNWSKVNPLPPDQAAWNVYSKMEDDNQRFLWGLLEQAVQGGAARNPNEAKIGDYFHACMDEAAVEQLGAKPLAPALSQIASLRSVEDIASYVNTQHKAGLDRGVLFGFDSEPDYDDPSRMMAFALVGGLGLPDRDYYTNTDAKSQEIRARYVKHMADMLALLGEAKAAAQSDSQAVMEIETSLAKASLTRTEKRNPYNLKHRVSRGDLAHMVPVFDWDVYLKSVDAPSFALVNVTEPKFFAELNTQLGSRDLAAWRAYFALALGSQPCALPLGVVAREHFAFFNQYLQGAKEMPPRWKKCTRLVDEQLGDALGQVFVAKTFAPQTKADALQTTQQIEAEMDRDLKDLNWMSDSTTQQAFEKLHALVNKIGYPDKWRDYRSVAIARDNFLTNALHAGEFEQNRQLTRIGKPVDRTEWDMTPPTVDAYYNPQTNDINFPAGVLQPPLFDPKMDAAPNYGNTGATIGHELTHGFDDEGRQFDAKGNLRDWWTAADTKAFEERVSCVRDQYAKYVAVDDVHINSSLTLGEDVADLGGTYLAFLAWKRANAGQDLKPVDDLTPDQRFFVGMAQWACGEERPELKRMLVTTDPHSPLEFRINGVVSNLSQFGEALAAKWASL